MGWLEIMIVLISSVSDPPIKTKSVISTPFPSSFGLPVNQPVLQISFNEINN